MCIVKGKQTRKVWYCDDAGRGFGFWFDCVVRIAVLIGDDSLPALFAAGSLSRITKESSEETLLIVMVQAEAKDAASAKKDAEEKAIAISDAAE